MKSWPRLMVVVMVVTLGAWSVSSASAGAASVRIGSASSGSGQEVTVRLEALGIPEPGVGAVTVDVSYDPGVVSVVSCKGDPDRALDTIACNTEYAPHTVRVAGYRTTGGVTGLTLADLTFRLSGSEGACSDLTVSVSELVNPTGALLSASAQNGTICVREGAATPASTPAATPGSVPPATANPDQPVGTSAPDGQQPPLGTAPPGQTGSGAEPATTPGATSSSTQGSEDDGATPAATRATATGNGSEKSQSGEGSDSDDGPGAWLIAAGVLLALVGAGGAGFAVWKLRQRF